MCPSATNVNVFDQEIDHLKGEFWILMNGCVISPLNTSLYFNSSVMHLIIFSLYVIYWILAFVLNGHCIYTRRTKFDGPLNMWDIQLKHNWCKGLAHNHIFSVHLSIFNNLNLQHWQKKSNIMQHNLTVTITMLKEKTLKMR